MRYWREKNGNWKWGRQSRQLLDDFKETRIYWNLKEEKLDRTLMKNSLRKRIWTCCKTNYEWMN